MAAGGEAAHVGADLGQDDLGRALAHPGDGAQQLDLSGERGGGRLDARRQGGDVGFELLHVGEHPLQDEGVMRREPGGEGLAQRRATGAKDRQDLASRQLVRLRVASAAASR